MDKSKALTYEDLLKSDGGKKDKKKKKKSDKDTGYLGFEKLKQKVAAGGASDPGAVAAAIGRKKYGKQQFQHMAATGKKAPTIGAKAKKSMPVNDTDLAKSLYGMRNDVTQWANQFWDSPYKTEALQVLKEKIQCNRDRSAMNKNQKSWREIDEMPRTQRIKERENQDKEREKYDKKEEEIDKKMADLEMKLIEHRIAQEKVRDQAKNVSKSIGDNDMSKSDHKPAWPDFLHGNFMKSHTPLPFGGLGMADYSKAARSLSGATGVGVDPARAPDSVALRDVISLSQGPNQGGQQENLEAIKNIEEAYGTKRKPIVTLNIPPDNGGRGGSNYSR